MGACTRRIVLASTGTKAIQPYHRSSRARCLVHALPEDTPIPHQASKRPVKCVTERRGDLALSALVFGAGIGALGTEITASRLLAPYFGSSTIVWANLIGIVLAETLRARGKCSAAGETGAPPETGDGRPPSLFELPRIPCPSSN